MAFRGSHGNPTQKRQNRRRSQPQPPRRQPQTRHLGRSHPPGSGKIKPHVMTPTPFHSLASNPQIAPPCTALRRIAHVCTNSRPFAQSCTNLQKVASICRELHKVVQICTELRCGPFSFPALNRPLPSHEQTPEPAGAALLSCLFWVFRGESASLRT